MASPTSKRSENTRQQTSSVAGANAAAAARIRNLPAEQVLESVMLIMRPLVRLLVAKGIVFAEVSERLKRLFINVANEEAGRAGQRAVDSRVAVMTGVHRKDVKRFREEDRGAREPKQALSLSAQALFRWSGDSRFMKSGRARPLLRRSDVEVLSGKRSRESSFDDLIETVSKDLPVRAVLDEWIRLGVARINESNEIEPLELWASSLTRDTSFFSLIAVHGYDRLNAAVSNFISPNDNHPVFSVDERGLSSADVATLVKIASPRAKNLLDTINERAVALKENHKDPTQADMRIGVGFYFYAEPLNAPGSQLLLEWQQGTSKNRRERVAILLRSGPLPGVKRAPETRTQPAQ
jgi:Family of unknown function (DUF6502)